MILGSLPSDQSIRAGQYYANAGNDLWRVVGEAIGVPLAGLAYEEKLARLKEHQIGLWDVYQSALRTGSQDKMIRDPEWNDFSTLRDQAPNLRRICFNGVEAAKAGAKLQQEGRYEYRQLPSSSGANRRQMVLRHTEWNRALRLSE